MEGKRNLSDAAKANMQKWRKENQRRLATQVDQETADQFTAFCSGQGKTAGAILQAYVYACIGKTE